MINPGDLSIPMLGHCMVGSPIQRIWADAHEINILVSDKDRVLLNDSLSSILDLIPREESGLASFELKTKTNFQGLRSSQLSLFNRSFSLKDRHFSGARTASHRETDCSFGAPAKLL